jgi:hypothetical protein
MELKLLQTLNSERGEAGGESNKLQTIKMKGHLFRNGLVIFKLDLI